MKEWREEEEREGVREGNVGEGKERESERREGEWEETMREREGVRITGEQGQRHVLHCLSKWQNGR